MWPPSGGTAALREALDVRSSSSSSCCCGLREDRLYGSASKRMPVGVQRRDGGLLFFGEQLHRVSSGKLPVSASCLT